ncbi:helix-turn-helix domain-containing protein [Varunaivibrio sulfuroxidans]|uniref:helix-turn-helix domain-containing protein n=1 Tax=Varunaivibrio sulfuroxidans TaxID=1773489 RepID=UPI0010484C29|nr:helix-turn-helix transcriptional regulator [Varunaivibrio sulfuroxidans]WES30778.1 helix-turn-helix transcriptional regulator [Varunaivibrio sulfuroxidans]
MVSQTPQQKNNSREDFGVSDLKSEIAERIRSVIRDSGGNAVVAEKSGVPLRTVGNYTTATTEPKIVSLSKIAQTCGVSLDWIATGQGPKNVTEPTDILDADVLEVSYKIAEEMFGNQGFTPEYKAKILMIIYEKGLEEKKKC